MLRWAVFFYARCVAAGRVGHLLHPPQSPLGHLLRHVAGQRLEHLQEGGMMSSNRPELLGGGHPIATTSETNMPELLGGGHPTAEESCPHSMPFQVRQGRTEPPARALATGIHALPSAAPIHFTKLTLIASVTRVFCVCGGGTHQWNWQVRDALQPWDVITKVS
jgi:hypothetical protein